MKKAKTFTRKEAIQELINNHGLDYLNANNIIQGRREIPEADLKAITERLTASSAVRTKKPNIKKLRTRQFRAKKPVEPNRLYSETKNYITSLDWGEL